MKYLIRFDDGTYNRDNGFIVRRESATRFNSREEAEKVAEELTGVDEIIEEEKTPNSECCFCYGSGEYDLGDCFCTKTGDYQPIDSYSDAEKLNILYGIGSLIYMHRHITLNEEGVVEQLKKLDKLFRTVSRN